MKPKHYSFNLFQLRCPRAIIKKVRGDTNESILAEETEEGLRLHEIAEAFFKDEITENELRELYDSGADGLINLKRRLQEYNAKIEVEKEMSYEIDGNEIVIRPDLVAHFNGTVEIYEFKSAYSTSLPPRYEQQLSIYVYPFLEGPPFNATAYVMFLRYGSIRKVADFEGIDKDRIEAFIKKEIKRIDKILDKGEETLRPSPFSCRYCPYLLSCPVFQHLQGDSIEETAKRYVILKEQLKQLEQALKLYVDRAGNLKVDDYEIGYFESDRLEIDTAGVIEYIANQRPELAMELLKVDTYKFRRHAKKDNVLANFGHYERTTRWGIREIKEEK